MLVGYNGWLAGTIGGGAVEKKAIEKAVELVHEKRSLLHDYQLRSESADNLDMACGGDVRVLFQYVDAEDPAWRSVADAALARMQEVKGGWLVQRLDGGTPALIDEKGTVLAGDAEPALQDLLAIGACALTPNSFAMPLPVGERAIIFGGGHCGLALAPVLKSVGFRVILFDDREEFANRERFPSVDEVICGDYLRLSDYITFDANDYVAVMTTGHRHDFEVEEQALRHDLAYIGVMGSAQKTLAVNARLRERGISDEDLNRVYTPIGLNIGGHTPAEIAISITAEMIQVRSQKRAGSVSYCPA
jgi:xanthine dehydrogenase accessory factor